MKSRENPIINTLAFKSLSVGAQWVFFTALGEGPRRCGIVDVWPKRISKLSTTTTEDDVVQGAKELDRAGVAYFDDTTDELLFPGYLTEVTNVKNSRHVIAVVNSVQGVASHKLVGLVIHELQALRAEQPEAAIWDDPRVVELMARPAIDPTNLAGGAGK
jgi:hypothetical protein